MRRLTEDKIVLKRFKSFILGKCNCGYCDEDIPIRARNGHIQKFKNGHQTRGKNHHRSTGGVYIDEKGYRRIKNPLHPNSNKKGYIREHVLRMSQYLGRPLTKGEIIHHIDENRLNNDISNLELVNRSVHLKIHMTIDMSNRQCELCGSKTTYIKKSGRPQWFTYGAGVMCEDCYEKQRWKNGKKF